MKQLFYSILAALMGITLLSGCDSDNDGYDEIYQCLATYEGQEGSRQHYVFYTFDNDTPYSLYAEGLPPTELMPGQRILLYYTRLSGQDAQHSIKVEAIMPVYQANYETVDSFPASDFYHTSDLFMTGEWLNFNGYAPEVTPRTDRRFNIYVDRSTFSDSIPSLFISTTVSEGASVGQQNEPLIASFNLATIWGQPGCKGIKVHVYKDDTSVAVNPTVYILRKDRNNSAR